jgi:hypothetical protein
MVGAALGLRPSKSHRGTLVATLMRRLKQRGERSDVCLETDEETSQARGSVAVAPQVGLVRIPIGQGGSGAGARRARARGRSALHLRHASLQDRN